MQTIGSIPGLDGYLTHATTNNPIQNDGVVIYARENLKCDITEPSFDNANCLLCRVGNTAIVSIYRSPSYKDLGKFYTSLDKVTHELNTFQAIAVMGDLNVDIKPDNIDRNSEEYLLKTASMGLLPAFLHPTREGNCLDHILLKTKIAASTFTLETHVTDHSPTILCINQAKKSLHPIKTKTRINYETVINDLKTVDLAPVLNSSDVNTATNNLINIFNKTISKSTKTINIPRKSRTIKPWIAQGLVRCIRNRDRMHQRCRKDPNNIILKLSYTRYRNFCNKLLHKLKHAYEKSELNKAKNNPKALWNVIKNITSTAKKSQTASSLLKLSGDELTSTNLVNDFFASVGKNLASKIVTNQASLGQSLNTNTVCNSMAILPVNDEDILTIINTIRIECATGWDNIPAKIIKLSQKWLASSITHICNLAISQGVFPDAFKNAIVTPVYKSGDRNLVPNYRPISAMSALSKILERVLNNSLVNFLSKQHILADNQYGFRADMSTEEAVVDLVEAVVDNLDKKFRCYGIFLDLSKAFDTVSVPTLVQKMEKIGVRVKIDNIISKKEPLCYGVPQGSILGPTLFQIYINDLCKMNLLNCDIFTYADDTALIAHGKNWNEAKIHAEDALQSVMIWLSQNLLTLNIEKTKCIRFSLPNTALPDPETAQLKAHICNRSLFDCNCVALTMVDTINYLGVIIDMRLNWRAHIESLITRTRRLIYVFKNVRYAADLDTLVYLALCQSILMYCIPAWGGTHQTDMLKLERAQRAVLKVLSFRPRYYSTEKLYKECEVLSVRKLYVLRSILRRHSKLPLDLQVCQRRRGHIVCSFTTNRTAFAQRQFKALSARLYNRAHNSASIYTF